MNEQERDDLLFTTTLDAVDLAHKQVEIMKLHMPQVDWDTGTLYCPRCGPPYPCETAIVLGLPLGEEPA